ncbi:hypothetical protein A946_07750 [Methylacidiphilum kamchatkense Kam1]|uniref:Uncharacterized protein n=1 Tax=Methylacidiphilum kamchatkense Kam1 TaxID=1202785 RepID=A0A0C1UPP3_9BACT|nr:hypothetical protein [Methylacidiphilum kamchatkense]KIE58369.1 hypothetical protein A946_07750 [Methylacidiphilum kamchatkense Kam1]QDQ42225.1 hypothetical protein kam1_993 [Methylacidiphilum kamchatkense Kam1]
MIYHLSLKAVAFGTGFIHLLLGTIAFLYPSSFCQFLKNFPRNDFLGKVLMGTSVLWVIILLATMDLGEYTQYRIWFILFAFIFGILVIVAIEDFISLRALALLLLLGANVILDGTFLSMRSWRILLVLLAYGWILVGVLFVGMPYLARDKILYFCSSERKIKLIALFTLLFGLVLSLLGFIDA